VRANLAALKAEFPNGAEGIWITQDNGWWNFWDGAKWNDGGPFQSIMLADGSVNLSALSDRLRELLGDKALINERMSLDITNKFVGMRVGTQPTAVTQTSSTTLAWIDNNGIKAALPIEVCPKILKMSYMGNGGGVNFYANLDIVENPVYSFGAWIKPEGFSIGIQPRLRGYNVGGTLLFDITLAVTAANMIEGYTRTETNGGVTGILNVQTKFAGYYYISVTLYDIPPTCTKISEYFQTDPYTVPAGQSGTVHVCDWSCIIDENIFSYITYDDNVNNRFMPVTNEQLFNRNMQGINQKNRINFNIGFRDGMPTITNAESTIEWLNNITELNAPLKINVSKKILKMTWHTISASLAWVVKTLPIVPGDSSSYVMGFWLKRDAAELTTGMASRIRGYPTSGGMLFDIYRNITFTELHEGAAFNGIIGGVNWKISVGPIYGDYIYITHSVTNIPITCTNLYFYIQPYIGTVADKTGIMTICDWTILEGDTILPYNLYLYSAVEDSLRPWNNLKFMTLGDSITAAIRDSVVYNWPLRMVQKLNGASLVNVAVSGAVWRDWSDTVLDGNPISGTHNNTISNQIQKILNNNYDPPDVIGIFAGINDTTFTDPVPYENQFTVNDVVVPLSNADRTTWAGSMRYAVETLQRKYPNAQIFLGTPMQNGKLTTTHNYDAVRKRWEIITELAARLSVPVIDLFKESGFYDLFEYDLADLRWTYDQLHPANPKGLERLATVVSRYIARYFSV